VVLVATAQQPADPEQRIPGVSAVAQGVVLNAAVDLVEGVEAEGALHGTRRAGSVGAERGLV
jgi:hypothetical protein